MVHEQVQSLGERRKDRQLAIGVHEGPHDANYLFDRFAELVRANLSTKEANA